MTFKYVSSEIESKAINIVKKTKKTSVKSILDSEPGRLNKLTITGQVGNTNIEVEQKIQFQSVAAIRPWENRNKKRKQQIRNLNAEVPQQQKHIKVENEEVFTILITTY